jgi:predicted nucleic acid-binding protein
MMFMPVISQGELLVGVELTTDATRRAELRDLYEQILEDTAEVLPIDSRVAEHFAPIVAQFRRDGRPLGTNDIWIAAIALAHGLTRVSNDGDLRNVKGLRVEDWTSPPSEG